MVVPALAALILQPWMIIAFAVAIPIFIFGIGSVYQIFSFMFSPALGTGIPVWAIFVIGFIFIIIMRGKKVNQNGYS